MKIDYTEKNTIKYTEYYKIPPFSPVICNATQPEVRFFGIKIDDYHALNVVTGMLKTIIAVNSPTIWLKGKFKYGKERQTTHLANIHAGDVYCYYSDAYKQTVYNIMCTGNYTYCLTKHSRFPISNFNQVVQLIPEAYMVCKAK